MSVCPVGARKPGRPSGTEARVDCRRRRLGASKTAGGIGSAASHCRWASAHWLRSSPDGLWGDRVRIGLFTDTYVPDVNGVVTVIQLMERELRRAGHDVCVFAPTYPGHEDRDEDVHRFPSVRMVLYRGMRLALPLASRRVFRLIAGLDVVHSHDPFSVGQVAFWAAWRHRIPHLHTYHALYTELRRYVPYPFRPSRQAVELISRAFCNVCDGVIAPSRPVEEELRSYGVTVPVYCLPFGVDEDEFTRPPVWNARQELGLPACEMLLFAGRLGWEKNLEFLLRSFRAIRAKRPGVHLVIAGDGPQRLRLESCAADLGIRDGVTFTGSLPRGKLLDLYRLASVFVFASKTETQGLVLVEAMMAGVPVVAVGSMGPLDIVIPHETGMLVDEDEEQFAAACVGLLSDEERRKQLGEAARQWASARSARVSTAHLLAIYQQARERRQGDR